MSKNKIDFLLHALGGAVIYVVSTIPAGLLVGWATNVLLASGISATICAAAVGYFRELEQFHYNGGNRWDLFGMSAHKHTEALAWPLGAAVVSIVAIVIQ